MSELVNTDKKDKVYDLSHTVEPEVEEEIRENNADLEKVFNEPDFPALRGKKCKIHPLPKNSDEDQ